MKDRRLEYFVGFLHAIQDPRFSHARYRSWCGWDLVYAYHRRADSPSGVLLAGCIEEVYGAPLLAAVRRPGALSPTEGLR